MGKGRCQGASCTAQSAAQLADFVKHSSALALPGVCAGVPSRTDHSHNLELSARGKTYVISVELGPKLTIGICFLDLKPFNIFFWSSKSLIKLQLFALQVFFFCLTYSLDSTSINLNFVSVVLSKTTFLSESQHTKILRTTTMKRKIFQVGSL